MDIGRVTVGRLYVQKVGQTETPVNTLALFFPDKVQITVENGPALVYNLLSIKFPDKANPFVRRGRKATGLEKKTAGLPKDDAFGLRGFLYLGSFKKSQ